MLLLRRMVGATAHPSTMYGQSSVGDKGGETVLDVAVVYVLCASVSYCMGLVLTKIYELVIFIVHCRYVNLN